MEPQAPQNNYQNTEQSFGYPTAENPYPMNQQQPKSKKKFFAMVGGGIFAAILLLWFIFGGKPAAGLEEMQDLMQNTADAVAVLDAYQDDVDSTNVTNNLALSKIILRGNYQQLNDLYKSTYNSKKTFSSAPKPDDDSAATLDDASRDNQLDSEIIDVLKQKVDAAYQDLQKVKPFFSKPSSVETLNTAETDLKSVYEILQDQ